MRVFVEMVSQGSNFWRADFVMATDSQSHGRNKFSLHDWARDGSECMCPYSSGQVFDLKLDLVEDAEHVIELAARN